MQLAEVLSPAQELSHVVQEPAIPCQALKNRVPHGKKQVSPWWDTSGTGWLLFHPRSTWGQQKTQQESGVYRYLICMKFKMTRSMIL